MDIEKINFEERCSDLDSYFGASVADRAREEYMLAVKLLVERGLTVSTAESFTGGFIGKSFTDVPGSSAVFRGGIMAYVNEIKESLLGVSPETIEKHTEVSFCAAAEMAEGARKLFGSDIAISTTGYAGPTGGNEKDPVGTVYVGISVNGEVKVFRVIYSGKYLERETVRLCSTYLAVKETLSLLEK